MRELPVLNPTRCTACGRCVALCPADCLAMRGQRGPWLPRPGDCLSCNVCVLVCPTEAVKLLK